MKNILKIVLMLPFCVHEVLSQNQLQPDELAVIETVMVFSPHPDDDILGCGGALIKHVQNGKRVIIVYMTSGDAAYWDGTPAELVAIREEEAKRATQKIGINELLFLREPDGKLAPTNENIEKVTQLIVKYRPELVYAPHAVDGHKDHINTHWIVLRAIQKSAEGKFGWEVPLLLGYEVWTPLQIITHKLEISDCMELKLAALREHTSQISLMDFEKAIDALNTYRGILNFQKKMECFQRINIKTDALIERSAYEAII